MKSRFMVVEEGEDHAVRDMTMLALKVAHEDLNRQYDTAQADFIEALNRQLNLRHMISAIEFEQERREYGSKN